MTKIDTNTVARIKQRLEALPPRQPMRPYDLIAQLTDSVSDSLERGYDIDQLMSLLEEEGIKLARNTVRNYLSRAKKDRAGPGANGATEAASKAASLTDTETAPQGSAAPTKTSTPTPPTATRPRHNQKRQRPANTRALQ
jgi:hypothetical protein